MGTILADNGIIETSGIAQVLTDQLPDDIYVLSQPRIYGEELAWLAIAPTGLFHLDVREWQGEVRATNRDEWEIRSADGDDVQREPSPLLKLDRARTAIESFTHDEAPELNLPLTGLLVLADSVPTIAGLGTQMPVMVLEDAIDRILAPGPAVEGLVTAEEREGLARGFLDRRLAWRQPTSQPFVLSVGGIFRPRLSANTIEELFALLDQHPDAGVRHMMDGSLEDWLEQEGALHLTRRLRESLERLAADGRAALENFMAGSGYVGLPRSYTKPEQLVLGYATPEDVVRRTFTVERNRGRGFVHGDAGSQDTWITVEPSRFSGNCLFTVTADASNLAVGRVAESVIVVRSDVGGSTHHVPVTLNVRPTPSPALRRFVRPLIGCLVGAVLGWVLGSALASALASLWPSQGIGLAARIVVAGPWAILGLIRAIYQAPAWPTPYALGRWLLRLLVWAAVMVAVVFGLLGLMVLLFPSPGGARGVLAHWPLLLMGLISIAVLPGTLDEIARARAMVQAATIELENRLRQRRRRTVRSAAIGVALVLVVWALRPVYYATVEKPAAVEFRASVVQAWDNFQVKMDSFVDGLYVRTREESKPGRTGGVNKAFEWLGIERE